MIATLDRPATLARPAALQPQLSAHLFDHSSMAVMLTDRKGRVLRANAGLERMTGYSEAELMGERPGSLLQGPQTDLRTVGRMREALLNEQPITERILNYRRDGSAFWANLTIEPVFDRQGQLEHFVSFAQEVTEMVQHNTELAQEQSDWKDSLFYARRIQTATQPDLSIIEPFVQEHFVSYQPKAVVSGDFYWAQVREGQLFFAVADATGHGVPGAMMAMLGLSQLSQILYNSTSFSTSYLLDRLHERVSRFVRGQGAFDRGVRDGMDIALIRFNPISRQLEYSGARRPMILMRHGSIELVAPDRHSIGGDDALHQLLFQSQSFHLQPGDRVYLNTDGVTDQFGGPRKQKLMKKGLLQWLEETKQLPLALQREELEKRMNDWIGTGEQLDDILCAGLKF